VAALIAAAGLPAAARGADLTFNVSLVGSLNPLASSGSTNNIYADLWSDGNTVVMGSVSTGSGVTIFDISNPAAPTSPWRYDPVGNADGQFRDVIVRNGIGYFAIDSSTTGGPATLGGVHIVNLASPTNTPMSVINGSNGGFLNNHDLFLDGNFLYIADNRNAIMKVFNVANPASPSFVRNITTAGTTTSNLHDMTVFNGRMYTSNLDNGITEIYDVTNIGTQAPTLLGSLDVGDRNHSTWPNADNTILAVAREAEDSEVFLYDISNPASPTPVSTITEAAYGIDSFSAHNPIIVGDTLYVSWYQAGMQIFNIKNPASPVHLGAYDTFVGGDGGPGAPGSFSGWDGNWGLDVSQGTNKILLSNFDEGLFIVNADAAFRQVWTGIIANDKWQLNNRWDNGAGPFPDSSEMIAAFTDPVAVRTLVVDGALTPANPRVSTIEILSSLNYSIGQVSNGKIEMKSSSGPAKITMLAPSGAPVASTISAPLVLSSDLLVTNNAGATIAPTLSIGSLQGTGRTIAFAGSGNTALIASSPSFTGSISVTGMLTLRHGNAINGQQINLFGGTLALEANISGNFISDLNVTSGDSALITGNAGSGSGHTQSLDDITVGASRTLTLTRRNGTHLGADSVTLNGTLKLAPGGGAGAAAKINSLSIPAGGKLDAGDGIFILATGALGTWNGSAYTGVTGLVQAGRGDGSWNGSTGILTSMTAATTSGLTTLAVATADDIGRAGGPFGGINVSTTDIIIMYTWGGDADMNGELNGDDYFFIDSNILNSGSVFGFTKGDFDYNGEINGDDYFIIDANITFAQNSPPFPTGAGGGAALAAVPEPGSVALLAACSILMTKRHRRVR
jgi:hypothetical protein